MHSLAKYAYQNPLSNRRPEHTLIMGGKANTQAATVPGDGGMAGGNAPVNLL